MKRLPKVTLLAAAMAATTIVACQRPSSDVPQPGRAQASPAERTSDDESPATEGSGAVTTDSGPPRPWDGQPGSMMPAYSAYDLSGNPTTLASFRGQPILLNFWATWCVPCRLEFPELNRLQERLGDDLTVIGVSLDEHLSHEEVAAFAAEHDIGYIVLHDREGRAGGVFGVPPLPGNFLFDRHGRLAHAALGAPEGSLEALVAAAEAAARP